MMKQLTLLFFVVLTAASSLVAQEFPDMDKSPMDMAYYPQRAAFRNFADTDEEKMANMPMMRVIYSRPQKKDRDVFGGLVKYGEMWRIGANEATEIQFMQPVRIGDQLVPAGRYTMYAMVEEAEWTIYISLDLDGWGHYVFKPDESSIASIKVPVQKSEATIEAMGILFEEVEDGAHMVIGWDDTVVRVPIQF